MWRAEGSETTESGEWRFERFLAVVKNERLFTRWRQQVQEIEQAYRDAGLLRTPERRMPSFFDQTWDHAAMHANQTWETKRMKPAHGAAPPNI